MFLTLATSEDAPRPRRQSAAIKALDEKVGAPHRKKSVNNIVAPQTPAG